jgi:hypothetical protein
VSPTEDDLRSALRRGEGDLPDAGRVMARGAAQRDRRRSQVRAAVGGFVVVAAVAGGGSLLVSGLNGGSHSGDAGSAAGKQTTATRRPAAGASAPQASSAGSARAAGGSVPGPSRACPPTLPRMMLPGGGSPGQFGSGGPLFAGTVASATVCDFGPSTGIGVGAVTRIEFDGARARELAASMEAARKAPAATPACAGPYRPTHRIVVLAVTTTGRPLATVTATYAGSPCSAGNQITTNGTAVRYGWTPPADLLGVLSRPKLPSASRAVGSPIRS